MTENKSPAEEPKSWNGRMLPGGALEYARIPIGVNALDRDMLPSQGRAPKDVDYQDSPDEPPRFRPTGPR
jgi:hypothetical protein